MKSTFSVLFYLKRRPHSDGLCPIMVRITINGKAACFNSKQCIKLSQWDQKKGKVIGRTPVAKSINFVLDVIKADIVEKYNYHHILRKEPIDAIRLKEMCLGINSKPTTLLEQALRVNKIKNVKVTKSMDRKYKLTYKRLKLFLQTKHNVDDKPLHSIDFDFIIKFECYLRDEFKLSNNSVEKLMQIFRLYLTYAVNNGTIITNPFLKYRIKLERVERPYLTQEELDRIIAMKFSMERLQRVRDLFLFCCYTGLSYIDAVNLNQSNLEVGFDGNRWLVLRREKTGMPVRLRLLKVPSAILDKYMPKAKGNLLLPMSTNQRMNGYLKEIADCCQIHKKITFHTARHSIFSF